MIIIYFYEGVKKEGVFAFLSFINRFGILFHKEKSKFFYNNLGVQRVITYFTVSLNKLQHDGLLKWIKIARGFSFQAKYRSKRYFDMFRVGKIAKSSF